MIFDFFKKKKKPAETGFSIKSISEEFGYDRTVMAFAFVIIGKFNMEDDEIHCAEMRQFIREEADAARQGDDEAEAFARRLFPNLDDCIGAMHEKPDHPIDGPGGPQDTILNISYFTMQEDQQWALRFRCAIVERLAMFLKLRECLLRRGPAAYEAMMEEMEPNLNDKMRDAGSLIGILSKRHPKEMGFIAHGDHYKMRYGI